MGVLGTLVVRIAAEMSRYKADMADAANATESAGKKIEGATDKAGASVAGMGGAMESTAGQAMRLAAAAGPAGLAIGAAAAVAAAFGYAIHQGDKELFDFNKSLIMTGNYAGTTASQMQMMAGNISKVAGTKSAASDALTQIAGTGRVAGENLQLLGLTAVQMERTVGTKIGETAKVFAELGNEPVKASLKLNETLNYLTASTFAQIKAADQLGDSEKAAAMAQTAYATAMTDRMNQIKNNLGFVETAWKTAGDAAKWTWDRFLDVGREDSLDNKIADMQKKLEQVKRGNSVGTPLESNLLIQANLEKELTGLSMKALRIKNVTEAEVENAKAQKAGIAGIEQASAANERNANNTKKMNSELEAYRKSLADIKAVNPNNALLDPKLIAQTEAAIRKHYENTKKGLSDADKGLKLSNDLMSQGIGLNADFAEKWDLLGAAYAKGKISLDELTKSQKTLLEQQAFSKKLNQDELTYKKELADTEAAMEKLASKQIDDLDKKIETQQQVNDQMGLTKAQIEALNATKSLQSAIDDEEYANALRNAAVHAGPYRDAYIRYANALDLAAKKKRELAGLEQAGADKQAGIDLAKETAEAWKKGWEETDRIGRQAFTDWAVEGDLSAKKIGDSFKRVIGSAIYEITAKPILLQLYAQITGGPIGGTAGGSGAGGSGGPNLFTDFAGSVAGQADTFGKFLMNNSGSSQAMGDFGASLVSNSKQIGAYAEKASSILSYLEIASNFKDGSYGKSIGQGLGMAIGGPIGGQIGKEIGGFVDKLFTKGEYVASTGDASVGFDASGNRTRTSTAAEIGGGRFDAKLTEGADKLVSGLNAAYLSSIKALGGTAKYTDFYYGGNNSDGGKFSLGAGVGGIGNVFTSGEQKTSDEAVKLAASRAVFAAVQSSDMPMYLAKVFEGITAGSATQAQIESAMQYAGSLKQIRDALTETRTPLQVLQATVDEAITGLGTSAATFKTDFVAAIDAGITPEKLAEYVALGQNLDALAAAAGTAGDSVRSLAEIASERQALQDQLDTLTMSATELLGKQRDALDESNRALFDQVQVATTQAEAEKTRLAERATLQSQLDNLTLSATELLARQRDGLDESNRALFDQVQAAQAAKTAQDALAQATVEMANRVNSAISSLGDTRFDLENQLLGLQGNEGEVASRTRTRDLAKLTEGITSQAEIDRITQAYDYNDSLRAQVKALTDTKKAAEDSSRAQQQAADDSSKAAEQLRSTWQSATNSIYDEVRRLRGEVVGDGSVGYAQAQAEFATTRAQAAAGDIDAYKLLPKLSQTLDKLEESNSGSMEELQYLRARRAGSLEGLGTQFAGQYGLSIPKLATGTNYVPQDMLAFLHQGEEVTPRAWNPAAGGSGRAGGGASDERVVALLARLVELAVKHRGEEHEENLSIAQHCSDTSDILDSAMAIGMPTRPL